ncbi:hypothetical protein BDF19DRAFT_441041 [Syncephalis fuscata]|nr:hypothetical protein BDF19DRAFT_441041 [Syncephalis fuscata]
MTDHTNSVTTSSSSVEETRQQQQGPLSVQADAWDDEDAVFQYIDPVNPNLTCCICQAPFRDPVTTPCGHTFCRSCLARALEVASICPIDRQSLTMANIRSADPVVQHLVNELRVQCPNQSVGCERILSRQEVKSHMQTDCVHISLACPHNNCTERGTPSAIESHALECIHRLQMCHDCMTKIPYLEMETHRENCPRTSTQVCCPYCYSELPLSQLDAHTEECMDRQIHCRHRDIGCQWQGTRRASSEHLQSCIYTNIRPLLDEMRRRQDSLEMENRELTDRIQALEHEVTSLREPLTTAHPLSLQPNNMLDEGTPVYAYLEQQQHQLMSETDRLREQVSVLTTEMDSMDTNYRAQQSKEMIRQREEIQSLRSMCQSLANQLRILMTGGKPPPPPTSHLNDLMHGPTSNSSGNSVNNRNNIRLKRSDTSRQETKL